MKTTAIINKTEAKEIHFEMLEWKSGLQFIAEEIQFINQLLNSYIFEPNTPNLFERLQEFKLQMAKIEEEIQEITSSISKHENELGGMMECDTLSCDVFYTEKHSSLKKAIEKFYKKYGVLKGEVFNYAGGILKKNKNK